MRLQGLLLLTVIISLLTLSFSGCVDRQVEELSNNSSVNETSADAVVYIDDYEFHPYSTTISAGDTVLWINNDSVAFIIKGNLVEGGSFQSPTLRKNDTFSYRFDAVGTYKYELITHPWTNGGQIIVE